MDEWSVQTPGGYTISVTRDPNGCYLNLEAGDHRQEIWLDPDTLRRLRGILYRAQGANITIRSPQPGRLPGLTAAEADRFFDAMGL